MSCLYLGNNGSVHTRAYDLSTHGLLTGFTEPDVILSCESGLKSDQKWLATP